jgi:hypothetical protein
MPGTGAAILFFNISPVPNRFAESLDQRGFPGSCPLTGVKDPIPQRTTRKGIIRWGLFFIFVRKFTARFLWNWRIF